MNKMSEATDLHTEAMKMAEKALMAIQRGTVADVQKFNYRAFQLEKKAASLIEKEFEPTRSVLHRSAAALAIECGEISEAEQLIEAGLDGNPPDYIAKELRDLMLKVEQEN